MISSTRNANATQNDRKVEVKQLPTKEKLKKIEHDVLTRVAPSSAFENHGSAGGVPGIISCELRLLNRSTIVAEKWVLPPQWINIDKRIKFKPRKPQSSMSNSSSPETEATQLRCVLQDFGEAQFNVSYFMDLYGLR